MEDDMMRFNAETSEEARYWFVLADFVSLSQDYGLDRVLDDMLRLRAERIKLEQQESGKGWTEEI
jgi:hypothetical protein